MNLYVTSSAVGILRILIMLRPGRFNGANVMRDTVAGQTKLVDSTEPQQPRIRRTMRGVTSRTPFGLQRRVLISKWTQLISVTLYAGCIRAGSQPRLF